MNILMIEDDRELCSAVSFRLEQEGFSVTLCHDGEEGLYYMQETPYDLVILDRMLPHMNGIEVLKEARSRQIKTPVIILTALGELNDRLTGLNCGADDYMVKPFGVLELSARIRSLLRRVRREEKKDILSYQGISINKKTREASSSGRVCELTLKEFELLCYLLENQARVVTRDELLNQIWGYEYDGETRTLDMHIRTLRQKLGEEGGSCIKTVRGVGYRLVRSETKEEDR